MLAIPCISVYINLSILINLCLLIYLVSDNTSNAGVNKQLYSLLESIFPPASSNFQYFCEKGLHFNTTWKVQIYKIVPKYNNDAQLLP